MEQKRCLEDAVSYRLYDAKDSSYEHMVQWRAHCLDYVSNALPAFVWQKDPFQLFVKPVDADASGSFVAVRHSLL